MFIATNACGLTQLARAAGHEFDRAAAMAHARAAGLTGREDAFRSTDEVGFAAADAPRVNELHLRQSKGSNWDETPGAGDIDLYQAFAALSAAALRFNVPTISAIQTTATGGGQTQVTRA